MAGRRELATVAEVHEERSWLFTATDAYGDDEEVILVPCGDGVEAWVNRCTHEAQRFDRGRGVAMRGGQVICPKHGSMFDSCTGYCDNGEAADTTLVDVDVDVEDGTVYLVDDDYTFAHEGGVDDAPDGDGGGGDDDGGPSSTSHLSF
ncbi:Rieske 2Fe-2S domain-containing protein (plasmid) [Halorarum halophilum]|uniref:Rieske 2Fe-2S domain-containing protein n=1 Tax=Halorarum halophilum TaxID=2743090 RepID=A0A7D5GI03_9EURY|nr:Rieske 2Fe-2S domain-containing protein [Halobaculum halophilum]QLG29650.1 Rieske 2Fe-2S domain-containing protein [Halobaculum halophilum]